MNVIKLLKDSDVLIDAISQSGKNSIKSKELDSLVSVVQKFMNFDARKYYKLVMRAEKVILIIEK